MTTTLKPDDVLDFWCGEIGEAGWYKQDDAIDAACRDRFLDGWHAATRGAFGSWSVRPEGALALLVLLDQIPRNMFRGDARAFATDARARAEAKAAIDARRDLDIPEPERQFFYLPLMHGETLADQCRCIRMILLRMPDAGDKNLPHAIRHRAVIRRFGRFPSRNAALGRRDTDGELAYRAEGGYMS